MSIAETFAAYVMAFEKTFVDDDWSRLEPFFTIDAVYHTGDGTVISGRAQVFAHLKESLDTFDRLFDSRRVQLTAEPVVTADQVTIQWLASYTKTGIPEVTVTGSEVATFLGNAISRLEDALDDGVAETFEAWTREHGARLRQGGVR
jgi:hypothetical protein